MQMHRADGAHSKWKAVEEKKKNAALRKESWAYTAHIMLWQTHIFSSVFLFTYFYIFIYIAQNHHYSHLKGALYCKTKTLQ